MIHTGATSEGRNVALQSDFPEARVAVLWFLLAQKAGGSTCHCEAKIQMKQEFSLRGQWAMLVGKTKIKMRLPHKRHTATWRQEVKIKAMWGNSCTQTSFYFGSFLSCVWSLIFKKEWPSVKVTARANCQQFANTVFYNWLTLGFTRPVLTQALPTFSYLLPSCGSTSPKLLNLSWWKKSKRESSSE